ncbi:MAG: N-6 DNA methylase [Synergistaceae bacterium]|nr:N-6 DNA methylase [Synergistaceae bacterium]
MYSLEDLFRGSGRDGSVFDAFAIRAIENAAYTKTAKGTEVPYIQCLVRKKEIRLTPEEAVRQLYIHKLIHEYGYSAEQMELERPIHFGREVKRADIVVFEKAHPNAEYIIVETKKPKLSEGKEQLKSYCNATGATIGVWTNGERVYYYHRKDPNYFEPLTGIPDANHKLRDILAKPWNIDDLVRKDKLVSEKKSLKGLIEEMEDEVLANAGVDVFEEVFKLIYTKLYDEMESGRDRGRFLEFRNYGDTDADLKETIQKLFEKAQKKWPGVFAPKEKIALTPSHLSVCVSSLQDVKLFNSNLDVVDDAFEYLMSKAMKGEKGQYFTPRYVIDMCVRMLNPKRDETMIDTASGSCGFPVHTMFHVWKGILAEKGVEQSHLFTAEKKPPECEDYVNNNVFAIDYDEKAVRVARTLNLIAGDGRTNVLHLNTLDYDGWDNFTNSQAWLKIYSEGWFRFCDFRAEEGENRDFTFDIVMANPPFAGDIKESRIITKYELGKNAKGKYQSKVGRDILFIERNLCFLKPGGRMAIVLPQGRFNNSSDKYIRDFIAERCRVLAVVGLHGNVFKPHTGTKTSVLFVQKWDDALCPRKDDYPIFFATMRKPSKDNSGDKIFRLDDEGRPLLDSHGHMIVDHDLYNHEGMTEDGIAEAFAEFAKKEGLSFFKPAHPSEEPFNAARYAALMDGLECSEIMLSALERTKRIDAEFYKKDNLQVSSLLQKMRLQPFTESFSISDGNHMSISERFRDDGIPYYRGQDIYNVFIEEATPVYIDSGTFHHPHMTRSHLKRGDVLMSIVGAIVGNSAIVSSDTDATCSCKLAIMRSKGKGINPETLLTFIKTEYGQNQIQKFKRGAAQTGLLLEDFDQLFIPEFSITLQSKIKSIIEAAHRTITNGNSVYHDAQHLLLSELRFDPSAISDKSTSVKSFSESFGASGRLDAEYYLPKYDDLAALLNTLNIKRLGEIVDMMKSIEPGSEYYGDEGVPFIRVSDVSAKGIDAPSIRIPKNTVPEIEKLYPKKDTILFSKDGSVGIAYKMEEDAEAVTSGALLHLHVKDTAGILPDYLTLALNSEIVQLQAERDISGAVIQHWRVGDIANVIIPILPYDLQREISSKVQESFALRREAGRLIESAVKAVERAVEEGEEAAMNHNWAMSAGYSRRS